ncbi:Heptaprenyl diphosphate synthase component I [compost metagenome]
MFLLMKGGKNRLSLIGVSIAGSIAHNFGQLVAASIVMGTTSIMYYLPILLVTGIVTGIAVGY